MKKFVSSLILLLALTAILGPCLAPHDPMTNNLEAHLQLPSWAHPLGTDENGRDILSRLLVGARISLGIALLVSGTCFCLGVTIGFLAAYLGGGLEKIFLFVSDVFQAFPGILLAIAVAAFLPPGFWNIIFLLSLVGWVSYARVARAQILALRQKEFIEATQALGLPLWRVFGWHVLPNILGPLSVQVAFGMAGVILVESSLSFLGLGLPVTLPTWGRMLDSGSALLLVAPHISIFPGLAIMLAVLSFNFLGDNLRDRFSV